MFLPNTVLIIIDCHRTITTRVSFKYIKAYYAALNAGWALLKSSKGFIKFFRQL